MHLGSAGGGAGRSGARPDAAGATPWMMRPGGLAIHGFQAPHGGGPSTTEFGLAVDDNGRCGTNRARRGRGKGAWGKADAMDDDETGDLSRAGIGSWVRRGLVASARGLGLGVLSELASVVLVTLAVVSIAFVGLGVGVFLLPAVMMAVRMLTRYQRRLAREWSGMQIPDPYRPPPRFERWGLIGCWQRCRWLLSDPATWRDMLWMLGESTVGLLLAILPAALVLYGIEGVVVAPLLLPNIAGYGYGLSWFVDTPYDAWLAVPQGVLLLLLGLASGPSMLRLHARFARSLLAPTRRAELHLRVRQLTQTRSEAV